MSNSTGPLLLGGGKFPWNLRPHRHYSERACFVASLIGNTILAVLIKMEKNPVMTPYSRVLLLNIAYDYLYTIMSILLEIELEMNDGAYIFVVNGFPKHLSVGWQKALVGVWFMSIAATCKVAPVEFIFRYLRVCRSYTMTYRWLAVSGAAVFLISTWQGTLWYLAMDSEPDPKAAFGHLMVDPMWSEEGIVYYGADVKNVIFRTLLVSVTTNDSLIMTVLAVSTLATLKRLAQDEAHMSAKVRYMQAQLNRLMLAEIVSLTSVFVIPLLNAMIFLMLRVQFIGYGVFLSILLQWVPAVNPITTIFLVGPYRRQLFGQLKKRVLDISVQQTSVVVQASTATALQQSANQEP